MIQALLWLSVTLVIYWASKRLYHKFGKVYLSPLLFTPAAVIAVIGLTDVSYSAYDQGASWLSDMIEPATIALAVLLYKNFGHLKANALIIAASVGFGAIAAIMTSASFSYWLGLSPEIMDSLVPRSATTPIAVSVSSTIGGVPALTAAATLLTGLLSMIVGPLVVKWLRIRHPVARGVLFGTSAHSAGISKAMEYGALPGSIAVIALLVTAFVTWGAAPLLMLLFP